MKKNKRYSKQVGEILTKALDDAVDAKYCITCQYAYLRKEDGAGYCKYQSNNSFILTQLKPITDFDLCDHWEKKK